MKKYILLFVVIFFASNSFAASDSRHPKHLKWSFDGIFGTVDRRAAQRGYQVYKEVCASCHSLRLNSYRNLADLGFPLEEVKAIAAEAAVVDGPNDDGEMFERPGRISDRFVNPYPNEQAARAANSGAYPPDFSLITKARPSGPNYVYSLLTGYEDVPEDLIMGEGMYYNPYFSGGQIAMPPPLFDGLVEYQDGTFASVDQMSRDVTIFLQWTAEPEMEQRKRMGIKVMLFLMVFTVLFYFAKRKIWSDLKDK